MINKKRYFQWLDGELKGEVATLESISEFGGETFYNFTDGESCNLRYISKMTSNVVDLKGKFMVEVESPHNVWTFDVIETAIPSGIRGHDPDDMIPTLHDLTHSNVSGGASSGGVTDSDLGKEKLVPPKKRQNMCPLPDPRDYPEKKIAVAEVKKQEPAAQVQQNVTFVEKCSEETKTGENVQENVQSQAQQKPASIIDPVAILVDSCKKHSTEIPITLKIDLPIKTLYSIAENEFENGGEKFIDYIVKGIDTKMIIEAIKVSLASAYGKTEVAE